MLGRTTQAAQLGHLHGLFGDAPVVVGFECIHLEATE